MINYNLSLRKLNAETLKKIKSVYILADKQLGITISKYKLRYPKSFTEGAFYKINQRLAEEIKFLIKDLDQRLESIIKYGTEKSWELGNIKNDALVNSYVSGAGITTGMRASFSQTNLGALKAFTDRITNGFNLSDRIWNLTNGKIKTLEQYLSTGIATGKSAARISLDIRTFERNPDLIFRRVRDDAGLLRLSRPARSYSPGQGVYRSSYKNALRVSRTENMIAFHTSDFERRQQLPFIKGVRIKLSNMHPREDICDPMAGDYPKDFKFTGWHPQCFCYSESILASKKEFKDFLDTGSLKPSNIKSIPTSAKNYITKNSDLFKSMKSKPYFLTDNFDNNFNLTI